MTKAIVIRTIGDPEIAGAIVDGMTRNIIPLDEGELAEVKHELEMYKARVGVRAYGDRRRKNESRRNSMMVYETKPVGRVCGAVLAIWGIIWLAIYAAYDKIWNRG